VQVKPAAFPEDFAADVAKPLAQFMAISQVPIAAEIFGAKATAAAWSKKPSYAVIAKQDRMINPDLERFMAGRAKSETIELPACTQTRAVKYPSAGNEAACIRLRFWRITQVLQRVWSARGFRPRQSSCCTPLLLLQRRISHSCCLIC
jgi:hypothetical protein